MTCGYDFDMGPHDLHSWLTSIGNLLSVFQLASQSWARLRPLRKVNLLLVETQTKNQGQVSFWLAMNPLTHPSLLITQRQAGAPAPKLLGEGPGSSKNPGFRIACTFRDQWPRDKKGVTLCLVVALKGKPLRKKSKGTTGCLGLSSWKLHWS